VHGDEQLRQVERELDDVVERFIPQEKREGFVLQAKHLFIGEASLIAKTLNGQSPYWVLDFPRVFSQPEQNPT